MHTYLWQMHPRNLSGNSFLSNKWTRGVATIPHIPLIRCMRHHHRALSSTICLDVPSAEYVLYLVRVILECLFIHPSYLGIACRIAFHEQKEVLFCLSWRFSDISRDDIVIGWPIPPRDIIDLLGSPPSKESSTSQHQHLSYFGTVDFLTSPSSIHIFLRMLNRSSIYPIA